MNVLQQSNLLVTKNHQNASLISLQPSILCTSFFQVRENPQSYYFYLCFSLAKVIAWSNIFCGVFMPLPA